MQRLTVDHKTTYAYRTAVKFGDHRLMFRPRDSHDLWLVDARLTVQPKAEILWLHDVFSNSVAIASFNRPSDRLFFRSKIVVDRYPFTEPEFPIEDYARSLPFSYRASEAPDLGATIECHHAEPRVAEWTHRFLNRVGVTNTEDFLIKITGAIPEAFTYEERADPGVQSPVETLDRGAGSCRDFALFMMEAVRSVGLAARFVSGYLYDPAIGGFESKISGAGPTHAWLQVYLPGAGWMEFDPTNGSHGGHRLVPIAVACEPAQAKPVSGTYEGDPQDFLNMTIEVTVRATQVQHGVS